MNRIFHWIIKVAFHTHALVHILLTRNPSVVQRSRSRLQYEGWARGFYRRYLNSLAALSPTLAAKAAVEEFTTPRRVLIRGYPSGAGQDNLRAWELSIEGRQLRGWQAGAGPKILCVHGWDGNKEHFLPIMRRLVREGFAVVGFDAIGHGQSDRAFKNSCYFGKLIDHLAAVSKSLGPFYGAVGHSSGCLLLQGVAQRTKFDRVVYLAPTSSLTDLLDHFHKGLGLDPKIKTAIYRVYDRLDPGTRNSCCITALTPETLVVADPEDPLLSFRGRNQLIGSFGAAQKILFPGIGHMAPLRHSATLNSLTTFLKNGGQCISLP